MSKATLVRATATADSHRFSAGCLAPIRLVLVLGLFSLAAQAFGASEYADIVPETTILYVETPGVAEALSDWRATPFYRLWTDRRFEAFFQPIREELDEWTTRQEKARGLTIRELQQLFPGRMAFFVTGLRGLPTSRADLRGGWDGGLIAEVNGNKAEIRRLVEEQFLKRAPRDAERSAETFRGVKIYATRFRSGNATASDETAAADMPLLSEGGGEQQSYEYAFFDDYFLFIRGGQGLMRKVLSNYFARRGGSGAAKGLAGIPDFSSTTQPLKEGASPVLIGYLSLGRLLEVALDTPGLELLRKMTALRLDEFRSLAWTLDLKKQLTFDCVLQTTPNPTGVAGLLMGEQPVAFRSFQMVPVNATHYTAFYLDIGKLYALLREGAGQIEEDSLKVFDQAVAAFSNTTDVDILKWISKVGGEVAWFTRQPSTPIYRGSLPAPRRTFLFELKEDEGVAEDFARLVEDFLGVRPLGMYMESVDFQGFPVYSLRTDMGVSGQTAMSVEGLPRIGFAVANSFLIVSSNVEEVKEVLRHVKGMANDDIRQNPDFKRMLTDRAPDYRMISWSDVRVLAERLARRVEVEPFRFPFSDLRVERGNAPSPELVGRYFDQAMAVVHTDRGRLHHRLVMEYPEEAGGAQ